MKEFINKLKREEVIVILIFLIFAFGFNIYRVQGDGKLYYALLEKTLRIPDPESNSHMLKKGFFQSGCAFFNMPFYGIGYAVEKALPKKIYVKKITLRTAAINIGSNFYMILSLILIFKLLKKFDFKHRLISILSILFSTSAFVAAVIMPSYSHTVDIFVITLLIYSMISSRGKDDKKLFFLGAIYPIAITVRYLNSVLLIPFAFKLILDKKYKNLGFLLGGILITGWILPLFFYCYNGGIFNFVWIPEGASKGSHLVSFLPLFPKYAMRLLVHPIHGLFVWSPVTILAVLGLLKMTEGNYKADAYILLSTFLALVLMYGFLPVWHAGWSFSNRYLAGLFPVYAIGLAYFLDKYGKSAVMLALIGTLYSIFLFFNWYICIIHGQWGTPLDMIKVWTTGKSYYFSGGTVNLKIFLKSILELCRYKYILRIFI